MGFPKNCWPDTIDLIAARANVVLPACFTLPSNSAYANGEKIAARLAKRFKLPSSLTEEDRGGQIERRRMAEMSLVDLVDFHLLTLRYGDLKSFDPEESAWLKDRIQYLLEKDRSKKTS